MTVDQSKCMCFYVGLSPCSHTKVLNSKQHLSQKTSGKIFTFGKGRNLRGHRNESHSVSLNGNTHLIYERLCIPVPLHGEITMKMSMLKGTTLHSHI